MIYAGFQITIFLNHIFLWIRPHQGFSNKRLKQEYPRTMQRMPSSARYPRNAPPIPWKEYQTFQSRTLIYDCCWGICIWYWFNNTENGFWVGPFPFKWVLGLSHLVTEPKSQSRTPTFCTNMSSSLKWGAILVKDVVTYSHLGRGYSCFKRLFENPWCGLVHKKIMWLRKMVINRG